MSGCYHLAFLKGKFDTAAKTVSIDLPYETRDSIGRVVAKDFKPGVTIDPNKTAGMSITAAFQAVVSNTSTSEFINGWAPFATAPRVDLAVGRANADPAGLEYTPATLDGSSFSGTVTGLTPTTNTVFARTCFGAECSFTKLTPAS